MQVDVPGMEYVPVEHSPQLDAPDELENDPALQFVHEEAPSIAA
jgi:hypothetical protein